MRDSSYIDQHEVSSCTTTPDGSVIWTINGDDGYNVYVDGEQVTDGALDYRFVYWLSGRDTVLVLADQHGTYRYDFIELDPDTGEETVVLENKEDALRLNPVHHPVDRSILGFVSPESENGMTIHELNLDTGEVEEIAGGPGPIFHFDYSPDGERIVLQTGLFNDTALHTIRRGEEEPDTVLDTDGDDFLYFPNSQMAMRTYWGEDGILFGSNQNGTADVGVLSPSDESIEWLTDSEYDVMAVGWGPDGEYAYVEQQPCTALLYRSRGDSVEQVRDGVNERASWTPEGLAYVHREYDTPGEAVVDETVYKSVGVEAEDLVEPDHVTYESSDGVTIHGLLYEPDDATDAVVFAHGGPVLRNTQEYSWREQYLASTGTAVLMPDFRGSGGYGHSFIHATDEDVGGADVEDLSHAASFLDERGYDNVGVYGHSYGGFLTLMSLATTDAFAFGISQAGPPDWRELFDTMFDSSWLVNKFGGTPEQRPDLYEERSPITHAENITAPLMLVQGMEDRNVPPELVESLIDVLNEIGTPYDYVTYENEGHVFSRPENKADAAEQMAQFISENS